MASNNHVHILTMGGTIDKDYPRLTSGYAFEFGDESAASRILRSHPNLGISYDVTSVCQKDSLELSTTERNLLADAIVKICNRIEVREGREKDAPSLPGRTRLVVTHGTDTMIETALYIQNLLNNNLAAKGVVIAFTGATKPERFIDSDASFNLGCAIGATSFCTPGSVVICMNGNVVPVDRCVRGENTGLFQWKS